MEQILHSVYESSLLSLLDGFSGYNQVLVAKKIAWNLLSKKNWELMLMTRFLLDSLMLEKHSSGTWILHSEVSSIDLWWSILMISLYTLRIKNIIFHTLRKYLSGVDGMKFL